MRLIDADALVNHLKTFDTNECVAQIGLMVNFAIIVIEEAPTAEITFNDVIEFCEPRCLRIISNEFFEILKGAIKKGE